MSPFTLLNPDVENGLKAKTIIKIAINPENVKSAQENINKDFVFHEVKKGETLYSITTKYNVSRKDIKKANKKIDTDNIILGDILKIPTEKKVYEYIASDSINIPVTSNIVLSADTIKAICCDSLKTDKNRTLNIALILPLYLVANDTMDLSENIISRQERIYNRSLNFVEFYEGVLIALDKLKKNKVSVKLHVIDSEKDSASLIKALSQINPSKLDIILGPVYERQLEIVTKYVQKYNIPVVSPLSSKSTQIHSQPNMIMVNTPEESRMEALTYYFSKQSTANFVYIYNAHIGEYDLIQYSKTIFRNIDSSAYNNLKIKEVNYAESNITKIEALLKPGIKNYIVIPSGDQAFVNDIVTKLYQFVNKYDITICGLSVWEQYENVELEYLFRLNFLFATNSNIDYKNQETNQFVKQYREVFKTDPSFFSFRGFDVMNYFADMLNKYGSNLNSCISANTYKGLLSEFEFERLGNAAGYANRGVYLIQYNPEFKRDIVPFNHTYYQKYSTEASNSGRNKGGIGTDTVKPGIGK
ncbi:MAG: LysM peptidoglycan-binding domain-containing protein [Bacteroidales bacterium]|nr:LysM peptidoglycan-binding domain-containing protein [Bacteroidales bacterium]